VGNLAAQGVPVRTSIALPPPEDRSLSDVWSALGGELKPSLDLVCLVAIDAKGQWDVGPLVLEEPRFRFADTSAEAEEERRSGLLDILANGSGLLRVEGFARSGEDVYAAEIAPPFFELVPPPGRATLEVGCGEGRVARDLKKRGHRVTAIDASPTMRRLAEEADPDSTYLLADSADLP
ncbi:MAG: methyltransferase domain-containing protein, partial [Gemmatimonadaceae bacterium]